MKNLMIAINHQTKDFTEIYKMLKDMGYTNSQASQTARQAIYEAQVNHISIGNALCLITD